MPLAGDITALERHEVVVAAVPAALHPGRGTTTRRRTGAISPASPKTQTSPTTGAADERPCRPEVTTLPGAYGSAEVRRSPYPSPPPQVRRCRVIGEPMRTVLKVALGHHGEAA
jgi:hypothetical protein